MADLKRLYNIPLRKEFLKVPKYKRAKKAATAVRQFLMKHMKSDNILLGQELNMDLWKHGIKNPPHHVQVTAIKDDEGVVRAELTGIDYSEVQQKEKKEDDTSLVGRLKSKMGVDEVEEEKPKTKKAEKKEEALKAEAKPAEKKEEKSAEKPAEVKPVEKKEDVKAEAKPKAEVKPVEVKETKPVETKTEKPAPKPADK